MKFRFVAGWWPFARDIKSFRQIVDALRDIDKKENGFVILKGEGERELSVFRHDTGFDVERYDYASNSYWYAAKPQFKPQEFTPQSTESRDGNLRHVVFNREEVEAIFNTFYHQHSHFPIDVRWHSRPMKEVASLPLLIKDLVKLAGLLLLVTSPFIIIAALIAWYVLR